MKTRLINQLLALALLTGLAHAGHQQAIPPPPTDLVATLQPQGVVLLTWVNRYLPRKKEGGSITVQRGISSSLNNDLYWPSIYRFVSWRPISGPLPLKTTGFADVLPPGTDLDSVRYRVLVRNLNGVTISSPIVTITP